MIFLHRTCTCLGINVPLPQHVPWKRIVSQMRSPANSQTMSKAAAAIISETQQRRYAPHILPALWTFIDFILACAELFGHLGGYPRGNEMCLTVT